MLLISDWNLLTFNNRRIII